MNTPNPALAERLWQRHTLGQKLARTAFWLGIGIAVLLSLRNINVIWEFLWDAPEQMLDMVQRMFPPDYAYYRVAVHTALMETFHIATLGTIFALVAALPLSILAAHNLTPNRGLNFFAKTMLVASRSVNSLVWALLFIAVFGPGPLAGTAAIACRSVGFVGKLLGEALEEVPRGPIEALKAAGATQSSQILYGYWPAVKPAFWSIMLLRWDINVRESSVLGLVGAGGIGMIMNSAIDLFEWDRVAIILLTIFAVVVIAEIVIKIAVDFACIFGKLIGRYHIRGRKTAAHIDHLEFDIFFFFKRTHQILCFCNSIVPLSDIPLLTADME